MKEYKCLLSDFNNLEKRVKAISRKLAKYNMSCKLTVLKTAAEKVPHYAEDPETHSLDKIGEVILNVVTYTFEMPELKVGNWTPVSIIKHGTTKIGDAVENCNIVSPINGFDDMTSHMDWFKIPSKCEHCGSNRHRKATIMLRNNNSGEFKQVGTTCIKDFTGIDAVDVIGIYGDIQGMLDTPTEFKYCGESFEPIYKNTLEFLTACVFEIHVHGYSNSRSNEPTKDVAWEKTYTDSEESARLAARLEAIKIIEFFRDVNLSECAALNMDKLFYMKVRDSLMNEYTNCNGFVAYAPIAYTKYTEEFEKRSKEKAEKERSQWVGEVKDKVSFTLTFVHRFVFDSVYGLNYVYKFVDDDGDIFIWSTSKSFKYESGTKLDVAGTIKGHDTYRGEKQTLLTRCKVYEV